MDKNFQYFNNRNKYSGICIPRREEILNYLIKEKFLSEFSTDEEKHQVLYNLGITQTVDNLLALINKKANSSQLNNYVTLQYFLQKIQELSLKDEKAKGYFSSINSLLQEYPTGEKGDWAIVNVEGTWYVYRYGTQGWKQAGIYDNSIDLSEYVTQDVLELFQRVLVSGQNIKTINGESILGEGNIEISGGTSGQYATKEELNSYLSKEEFYNIQNPLKLQLSISSSLLEYTGNSYLIRINAQAKKGNSNVEANSYQISFNSITETFNKVYETNISAKGITQFNVSCTLNGETATGSVQVNLVLPTYIGFFNSSNFNEVNTSSLTKKIKDSISMTETVENTISGSYLWIVSPYNVNQVATDPGFTYKVEMILAGSKNGFKYYKSNSAVDISNLTYYIK